MSIGFDFSKNDEQKIRLMVKPDGKHGFHGYCPELSGVHVQSETVTFALLDLCEAIKVYLVASGVSITKAIV